MAYTLQKETKITIAGYFKKYVPGRKQKNKKIENPINKTESDKN